MMFCCDMSGPGVGPTGLPGSASVGLPQNVAADPAAFARASEQALMRARGTTIIGSNNRAGATPVDTSQAALEAAIASGDKQGLIAIFVAQGNTPDIAEKLAAVALSKATNVLYGDVPPVKPKSSFGGGLPKIDPGIAKLLPPKTTVQTIPGVTPPTPALTPTPSSSGGGGGGGGGGGSMWAFEPPQKESEKPPEKPQVVEKLPPPEVKKSSAVIPLLALAAIAYYAFKG